MTNAKPLMSINIIDTQVVSGFVLEKYSNFNYMENIQISKYLKHWKNRCQ